MNLKPNELLGVEQIPIGTLQTYSCNDLYQMLDRAQKELEQAKRRKEWIESTINLKYQEQLYSLLALMSVLKKTVVLRAVLSVKLVLASSNA